MAVTFSAIAGFCGNGTAPARTATAVAAANATVITFLVGRHNLVMFSSQSCAVFARGLTKSYVRLVTSPGMSTRNGTERCSPLQLIGRQNTGSTVQNDRPLIGRLLDCSRRFSQMTF